MITYAQAIFNHFRRQGIIRADGKKKLNRGLIESLIGTDPTGKFYPVDPVYVGKVYNAFVKTYGYRKGETVTVSVDFIDDVLRTEEKVIVNDVFDVDFTPTTGEEFNRQAFLFKEKGMNDRALAGFTKAIELDPKNWSIWGNRGALFLKIGEYGEAIKDLTEAISLVPKLMAAHYYICRAESFRALGRKRKAIKDGVRALIIILYRLFLQNILGRGFIHPHYAKSLILATFKVSAEAI